MDYISQSKNTVAERVGEKKSRTLVTWGQKFGDQWLKGMRKLCLKNIFLGRPFLKSFLSLLPCWFCLLFFWLRGIWDLSSLTRDHACNLCTLRWTLNHWTTRKVPKGMRELWMVLEISYHWSTLINIHIINDTFHFV